MACWTEGEAYNCPTENDAFSCPVGPQKCKSRGDGALFRVECSSERAEHRFQMPPHIQLRRVPLEDILPLRQAVLHPTLPLEALRQPYDAYPDTFHLAAFDGAEVVGCLSLTHERFQGTPVPPLPDIQLQLHKLAVNPSRQGQGIGKLLMKRLIDIITSDTAILPIGSRAVLHFDARLNATRFYESIGMQVLDTEIFTKGVEQLEHVRMGRFIP